MELLSKYRQQWKRIQQLEAELSVRKDRLVMQNVIHARLLVVKNAILSTARKPTVPTLIARKLNVLTKIVKTKNKEGADYE